MIRAAMMVVAAGCAGSAGGGLDGPDVAGVDQACLGNDAPPPTQATRTTAPPTMSPSELHRIAGERSVRPDDATQRAILDAHLNTVTATIKLCIDTAGVPQTYTILRSSCIPHYDRQIIATVHAWRYTPYVRTGSGSTENVCTAATFVYRQH